LAGVVGGLQPADANVNFMRSVRHGFVFSVTIALGSLALVQGCRDYSAAQGSARLNARPKAGVETTARGKTALSLGETRDGWLLMPAVIPDRPMPLLVLLHGAGQRAERFLTKFEPVPAEAGLAVLALDSRGQTWDAIRGGFGPDIAFIDRALKRVFGQVAVDPARVAIGGFSDGATYALSLGVANGDLFSKIVALSPGFIIDSEVHGRPAIFISHGTADDILPIDRTTRVIVPMLRARGYGVVLREFEGGHEMPDPIWKAAMLWVAGK
jgi:phospholipase/carboxylesterase